MLKMNRETLQTIVLAILGSTGLWTLISTVINRLLDKKSARSRILLGLGHDKIIYLGEKYISRGWVTTDEYENLYDYLYVPYSKMGGNGTAKKLVEEVQRLPIRKVQVTEQTTAAPRARK